MPRLHDLYMGWLFGFLSGILAAYLWLGRLPMVTE